MEVTTNGNSPRKNQGSDAQENWAKMSNNENDVNEKLVNYLNNDAFWR